MRAIFFPFEQMVKFINFQISTFIPPKDSLNATDQNKNELGTKVWYMIILVLAVIALFGLFSLSGLWLGISTTILELVIIIWIIRKRGNKVWHKIALVISVFALFGIFLQFNFWLAISATAIALAIIIWIIRKRSKHNGNVGNQGTARIPLLFIFLVCIFLAIIYDFTTKYYNENLDITTYWSWWPLRPKDSLNTFSAEKGGNYYNIMKKMRDLDSSTYKEGHPASAGGYENPNRVMLDPRGISFVKEEVYKEGDPIKDQINYVVPLYFEKLHILYNKKARPFQELFSKDTNRYLSLGFRDSLLIRAIRQCRIAAGRSGGGTKVLSSQVLSQLTPDQPFNEAFRLTNASLEDALDQVRGPDSSRRFDIVFFISGQPVEKIRQLLSHRDSFGLIGIEPSFVDALNRNHGTRFRYSHFSAVMDAHGRVDTTMSYDSTNYDGLPTLGTTCYLIANKKVKPYLIKKFIDDLQLLRDRDTIKIDLLNFKDSYDTEFGQREKKTLASLLLAMTGGVALGTVMLAFVFALISSFFHDKYSCRIADVACLIPDDSIPKNEKEVTDREQRWIRKSVKASGSAEEEFNKCAAYYAAENGKAHCGLYLPFIIYYQVYLINKKLVRGMSDLVLLRREINAALRDGKLNTEHYNDLLHRADVIMGKLRKGLFLRLHELLTRPQKFVVTDKKRLIESGVLLRYATANYLEFSDYQLLLEIIGKAGEQGEEA